jgi:DNA-directed RNA polymerase sigma subunit (sigma70/sigma32)
MINTLKNLPRTEVEYLIDQWVMGRNAERDREILRQRFVVGVTFDRLAVMFDLSRPRVEQIVYGRLEEIAPHVKK